MKYFVIFLIIIGFMASAYAYDAKTSHPIYVDIKEHYEIDIVGLKEEYATSEEYSFYFIISGYGHECASYNVYFPDETGNTVGWGVEPLCDSNSTLHEFEINSSEINGTLGNVAIKKLGIYTVTVTFDKPNKYFPTTVSKEFRVVESATENSMLSSPLKQFKSGISLYDIQCRESLILMSKYDGLPACVSPSVAGKLSDRGWGYVLDIVY